MTPERLREIVERHAAGEEWIPTARVRAVDLPIAQVTHADRGELLDLLRGLLNMTSKHTLPDGSGWNYYVHDDARARAMRAALGGAP